MNEHLATTKKGYPGDDLSIPHRRLRSERALQSMQGCDEPAQPLDTAPRSPNPSPPSLLLGREVRQMTYGKIVKLVTSYGSRWGRIQPDGERRDVFFNFASLPAGTDFADLREGQVVEFDEEVSRATGTHAVRLTLGELSTSKGQT